MSNKPSYTPLMPLGESDCDPQRIRALKTAVIGYGSQGRAQALNLRDSGVENLKIALRGGSPRRNDAADEGFDVLTPAEAAGWADILVVLIPDEAQAALYETEIKPHLRPEQALIFAHGMAVHFGLLTPPETVDVLLVAPKAIGPAVRSEYEAGRGVPGLIAVAQDASGTARATALSYAWAIGCARGGIYETSFAAEAEADLFSEQAVLCGGIPDLIEAGFQTLVAAGYPPEIAYFECLYEAKLVVDLLVVQGFEATRKKISNTAEYGGYTRGRRIVTAETKAQMQEILSEIQSGAFTQEFLGGNQEGLNALPELRRRRAGGLIDTVGEQMRRRAAENKG